MLLDEAAERLAQPRRIESAIDPDLALGAKRLEWGAEPNSVGFYEKVGGRKLRDEVTEWGRLAPWMGLEL